MVGNYAIEIKDSTENKTYLLCEEGSNEVLTFTTYEEDDYNYEFKDTLSDGLTSRVVKTSEYSN
ncbi:hypothetical protein [Bacillus paranthracis]|uniref:hypothetical protein n=1 Tax=Bacillus paranthracis TaxID=2026186 RepID=UPI0007785F45|nr:hypothetical protein [Bacillus paranthracis]KXY11174.1 hypothetical protein AT271_25205 [Bacillus cereus]MCC2439547.1 hypothetical protein [Bacillus paranthracis]MDG1606344.1 hypothetical protein [Bacillus paranthracis]